MRILKCCCSNCNVFASEVSHCSISLDLDALDQDSEDRVRVGSVRQHSF